ncbi:MAG: hypothetical protein H6835_05315 [Planctomycetes bacterium]|nr:hypothetical protein [Planctomycetota bacterium]
MKAKNKGRLARLDKAIHHRPLRRSAIDAALEQFRATGELPEQQRLADAVTRTVLDPGWDVAEETNPVLKHLRAAQVRVGITVQSVKPQTEEAKTHVEPSKVLRCLYGEAVWAPEPVRGIARKALAWHADGGDDVASPSFLADREMPRFGTVGFALLGYPDLLVVPPYEDQARRLFVRYGDLMQRKGPCNEDWERRFFDLSVEFYRHGKLPTDPVMRDIILGSVEIDALFEHKRGGNVAELMAALDAAARASGDERDAAIGQVVEVIRRTDVEIVGRIP